MSRARPHHASLKSAPVEPRRLALDLLQAVLRRRQPLDEALADERRLMQLVPRDRAFVRILVATTLRRLGEIDAVLGHCLERPVKAERAADLLRLGVVQLLFLGVAPHAAVAETLGLLQGPSAGLKGLANAVLRRIAREGARLLEGLDGPRLDTPDWLWQSWSAAYGEATARAIAEAHLRDPPLDLTPKQAGDATALARRLDARILPQGSLRLAPGRGEVARLPGYAEGLWWVQDAAASLPARLLGPLQGRRVIELCAAPGGKTAQLAAAGAEVIAVDQHAGRLARLRQNLERLSLAAAVVEADATVWKAPEAAPAVLLDAPCSATGTLRRHPDIAHLRRPRDLEGLTALQDRLLERAWQMLEPGGRLLYAVCSLQPEEGPGRIEALLAKRPPLARDPIGAEELPGIGELLTPEGALRSLPCHWPELGGLDGFYLCRLRRV